MICIMMAYSFLMVYCYLFWPTTVECEWCMVKFQELSMAMFASRLPDPENLAADLEVIPNAGMWEYEAETFQTFQWGFPEIGDPQMYGLYGKTLLTWMIWGYPYSRKTSTCWVFIFVLKVFLVLDSQYPHGITVLCRQENMCTLNYTYTYQFLWPVYFEKIIVYLDSIDIMYRFASIMLTAYSWSSLSYSTWFLSRENAAICEERDLPFWILFHRTILQYHVCNFGFCLNICR